jgi:DNA-binding MarR family transcriptional regulator
MVRSVPLAPAEERVLRKLWKSGPSTVAAAKATAVAPRLVKMGLITELPAARKSAVRKIDLTDAGRRQAERLGPEKVTPADLYRELVAVRERLDALADSLSVTKAGASLTSGGSGEAPAVDQARFERELQTALRELDRRGRHGGLVPVPELRRALAALGLSQRAFDEALLDRERAFVIDLKVAHDGRQLADAAEAVHDPGRGLLYYAVLR